MKRINLKKGFTLIELLVVVAIIGILASVVLASLNSARTKGKDAAAISSMSQARAGAEIAYSNLGNTYLSMCPTITGFIWGSNTANATELGSSINNAQNALGVPTGTVTASSIGAVGCASTASAYATWIKLNAAGWYCVDSTGFAGVKTVNTQTATETACL